MIMSKTVITTDLIFIIIPVKLKDKLTFLYAFELFLYKNQS